MAKSKISEFLNKEYPFNDDLGHNAKIISFISFVVLVFIYAFEPFNLKEISNFNKLKFILGIGVITFLTLSINLLVIPSFFSKIFEKVEWKVKKEIVWNLWLLLSVALGYFLYFQFTNIIAFGLNALVKIIMVSILPVSVLVVFNQNRLLRMNLKAAMEFNQRLMDKIKPDNQKVTFESEYNEENVQIDISQLRLIKSANNYIDIYWVENGELKHRMIRSSLKKVEEITKNYRYIFRCHRTAIINVKFIESVQGNSQGVKVCLQNVDFEVPVSRNNMNLLKDLI